MTETRLKWWVMPAFLAPLLPFLAITLGIVTFDEKVVWPWLSHKGFSNAAAGLTTFLVLLLPFMWISAALYAFWFLYLQKRGVYEVELKNTIQR